LPQREELPARPQGAIGSCCARFPPSRRQGLAQPSWQTCRWRIAWVASIVPSVTAIRNDDDRDAASKPSGACAAAGDPSPEQVPNRERVAIPTTVLASAVAVDPSPGQAPSRERTAVPTTVLASAVAVDPSPEQVPNRELVAVPTTELASGGLTVCRLGQDREQSASPPRPQ
jgi:hypothetical protein